MLRIPEYLEKIHSSDESRLVLGYDKSWIWYRYGKDKSAASTSSMKFPPSLMIFVIIGIGFKSYLLLVEGSTDTERYIDIFDLFGFGEALDAKYGPFG
jgi:hypothetical protein